MTKSIFVVALALVGFCVQAHADNGGNDVAAQFIITDCGTVHQIATDATADEAVDAIDRYSREDC